MKSRVLVVVSLAAVTVLGLSAYAGCSSSDNSPAKPAATNCSGASDPENPPIACGPQNSGVPKCTDTSKVSSCPSDNECMAVTKQSAERSDLRMGRIRLWAPDALLSLTSIAIDPNVNAACFNNDKLDGGVVANPSSFNWLMSVDRTKKILKTGGARKAFDEKTYSFLQETIDASKLSAVCEGFVGPTTPVNLAPVEIAIAFNGDSFSTTAKIDLINVPIFQEVTPIILPLREASMKDVTLSADGNCIGKWERDYYCDGDTLGWTTGGALVGKIRVEDSDKVPIKTAGCQSLCAMLANDSKKTNGKTCNRNADGTYPEIGDSCIGGTNCKNAFRLAATFSAYGVTIGTTPVVSETGPDGGAETGTDSGVETGGADTGTDAGGGG